MGLRDWTFIRHAGLHVEDFGAANWGSASRWNGSSDNLLHSCCRVSHSIRGTWSSPAVQFSCEGCEDGPPDRSDDARTRPVIASPIQQIPDLSRIPEPRLSDSCRDCTVSPFRHVDLDTERSAVLWGTLSARLGHPASGRRTSGRCPKNDGGSRCLFAFVRLPRIGGAVREPVRGVVERCNLHLLGNDLVRKHLQFGAVRKFFRNSCRALPSVEPD